MDIYLGGVVIEHISDVGPGNEHSAPLLVHDQGSYLTGQQLKDTSSKSVKKSQNLKYYEMHLTWVFFNWLTM